MTPCKCRRSTAHTKKRATSGYRSSSALTLKTSLARSFWTLPIRSTRGINKQGWELTMSRSSCFLFWPMASEVMQAGNGSFICECFWTVAYGDNYRTQLRIILWLCMQYWIYSSPWMSETLSSDLKPFPAGEHIGTYEHINNGTFILALFIAA